MAKGEHGFEDELEWLYSLPREDFISARDNAAKRARGDGDRERAARLRELKKPSAGAAALNLAVRDDRAGAERMLIAAERLERAQAGALGGAGGAALREAMAAHQEAVEKVVGGVRDRSGPLPANLLDRVRQTLHALAGNEELKAEFAAGRLTADHESVGFAGAAAAKPKPKKGTAAKTPRRASAAKPRQPAEPRKADAARKRAAATRLRAAKREAAKAKLNRDAAIKRARAAAKRLERAERDLAEARGKSEAAERGREQSERDLAAAESVVDDARSASG